MRRVVDSHHDRLFEELARQGLNLAGPRGRPHERLPLRAGPFKDTPQLRLKAQIEHPICLIEHHITRAAQVRLAGVEEVEEAPRGGDRDFDPLL